MTDSPKRTPKFRRRAEARPDEVLDAALELFIDQGYAATRVEDIARRAGISKGAVYLYFPSKEAIVEGLVHRAIGPLADSALGFLRDHEGDPRPVIALVLKMLARRFGDPRLVAIPKLILREATIFPGLVQIYRREVLERIMPVVETLLARGIDQGYLRPVDPELTIRSIVGPILAHLALAEIFGITPADGLAMDRMIDNHLEILFEGLGAPQGGRQWTSS